MVVEETRGGREEELADYLGTFFDGGFGACVAHFGGIWIGSGRSQ